MDRDAMIQRLFVNLLYGDPEVEQWEENGQLVYSVKYPDIKQRAQVSFMSEPVEALAERIMKAANTVNKMVAERRAQNA